MRFGAHLPLIDFDGTGVPPLGGYVAAAREAGFTSVSANDHLVFQRPWLDGIVALASVVNQTEALELATTVALPVVRGPAALAKAAAALDLLSGGRFVLGIGPGSSTADYDAVGVPFDERWPRFDEAVRVLRAELSDTARTAPRGFYDVPQLEPRPGRQIPLWIGSWGSAAGLRRVAHLGDGWLASAYNTTPEQLAAGRDALSVALERSGRSAAGFPIALATMWTYVTDSATEAAAKLTALAAMLDRDPAVLADRVLIGGPEDCAERLRRFAEAGVGTVFVWPVGEPVAQLRRFWSDVVPLLS